MKRLFARFLKPSAPAGVSPLAPAGAAHRPQVFVVTPESSAEIAAEFIAASNCARRELKPFDPVIALTDDEHHQADVLPLHVERRIELTTALDRLTDAQANIHVAIDLIAQTPDTDIQAERLPFLIADIRRAHAALAAAIERLHNLGVTS